jgi:hypothetical protein
VKTSAKIEFGDFQTPLSLAREVCALLKSQSVPAGVVIEPTCGLGSFLQAAAENYPKARLFGFDINHDHVATTARLLKAFGAGNQAVVRQQDFFAHDWDSELHRLRGDLLVLGNLPWVTNQKIGSLNGSNVPVKANFQNFRGLAARTGKSNFDISEWMLIQLVRALHGRRATIAMLCKTGTARKVLRYAWQNDGRVARAAIYTIDAKAHFNASVEACLLVAHLGETGAAEAEVFENLRSRTPCRQLGLAGQNLVADIKTYRRLRHLEGLCPYQWRSGVKHDCSSVMELTPDEAGVFQNKLGENVLIEPESCYPLLKCSDLTNGINVPKRCVLVTQKRVGDDTMVLADRVPRTWTYLNGHRAKFDARKSSIYNARTPFAMFGIGDYTFARWKVAISGLHRHPRFIFVPPVKGKPVLFDDTCYFLSFDNEQEARVVTDILNSEPCLEFLEALIFPESKRPITVDVLERLNLTAIAEEAGMLNGWQNVRRVNYTQAGRAPQFELVMEDSKPSRKTLQSKSVRYKINKKLQNQ